MNPGIFYLYEYNNTQKLRNAGFLKITRYYHSCTLQLNARGIPVSYADTIKLYVFYTENNLPEVTALTEITCANHALSARMTFAESQFPGGRTLDKVDGFFLLLPNGHILAAATPSIAVDTQKLLSASAGSPPAENPPDDAEIQSEIPENDMIPDPAETADELTTKPQTRNQASDETKSTNEAPDGTTATNETPNETAAADQTPNETAAADEAADEASDETAATDETPDETAADEATDETASTNEASGRIEMRTEAPIYEETVTETNSSQNAGTTVKLEAESVRERETDKTITDIPASKASTEPENPPEQTPRIASDSSIIQESTAEPESPRQNIRKIQRSDLSALPRRCWHLANNSFLLHGYHNYNHLLLVEKDGHYWLGVPGIYDPREARAARLFGFPQFTDSYNKLLRLSDEEWDPQGNFGYWCCYLK